MIAVTGNARTPFSTLLKHSDILVSGDIEFQQEPQYLLITVFPYDQISSNIMVQSARQRATSHTHQ
jgi:hypothetical protein